MSAPIFFKDSLEARAKPLRFRQIGNPYAFLNDVGIGAMLDEIRKGHNLVEICEVIDISIGLFLHWIECEGHAAAIEEAFKFSAEGHLAVAAQAIRHANNDFELKKAKELANHGRFMASKMDRNKYGAEQQKHNTGNTVQFILHMGQADAHKGIKPLIIEATDEEITSNHDEIINNTTTFKMIPKDILFPTLTGVAEPDDIGPFEDEPWEPSEDTLPEYLKARA